MRSQKSSTGGNLWILLCCVALCLLTISIILLLVAILTPNWYTMKVRNSSANLDVGIFLSCYDLSSSANGCPWTRDLDNKLRGLWVGSTFSNCPWDKATEILDATRAMSVMAILFAFFAILYVPLGQFLRNRVILLLASAMTLFASLLAFIGTIVWGTGFNRTYDCNPDVKLCDSTNFSTCRLDWSWYLLLVSIIFLLIAGCFLAALPVRPASAIKIVNSAPLLYAPHPSPPPVLYDPHADFGRYSPPPMYRPSSPTYRPYSPSPDEYYHSYPSYPNGSPGRYSPVPHYPPRRYW